MFGIIKWLKSLFRKGGNGMKTKNENMIVTLRIPIYSEKDKHQTLNIDTLEEPVKNLAAYLGFKEEKIIDWLIGNLDFRRILFDEHNYYEQKVNYFTTVQEPFTRNGENPGDIDLLAFIEIDKAIAIECKIVKATSQQNEKVKINKAEKLEEGALQVNDYLKFGFSQVYFLIIILDDGRCYNKTNFIFNHTSNEDLQKVYNGSWKDKLDKRIGIIYCSIEQTRNLTIDENHNISYRIERIADHIHQNENIIDKLKTFVKSI